MLSAACAMQKIDEFEELMKEYNVSKLALILGVLEAECKDLQLADAISSEGMSDEQMTRVGKMLNILHESCKELGIERGILQQVNTLRIEYQSGAGDRRHSILNAKARTVLNGIEEVLYARKFLLLSEEEAGFYANGKLFGDSFQKRYSIAASREALCAGNCYAASQYTACVFHCMRVAEYALRKLAANRTLRIKLTKKGKPYPIEYGTWQDVITAIQNKIKKIRMRPLGPKREAELQFLSNAADHCEYMKDLWRNELSHTRRWYKKEEALGAINRVKDFVRAVGEHHSSPVAEDSLPLLLAPPPTPPSASPLSNLEMLARLLPPKPDNTSI
ncbi:MAG TPA: hypothetical protein VFW25_11380 [Silvibacterium sp.]|nr:hypothetical protein [Silvibacterium sp.]